MGKNPRRRNRRLTDLHLRRDEPNVSAWATATLARPYREDSRPFGRGGLGSRAGFLRRGRARGGQVHVELAAPWTEGWLTVTASASNGYRDAEFRPRIMASI